MFICLKNALMPSEDQQVLRLRQTYLMHRFLFVTLFASLLIPTVAKAQPVWLLIKGINSNDHYTWQIPTKSKSDCEAKKEEVINIGNWEGAVKPSYLSAICL